MTNFRNLLHTIILKFLNRETISYLIFGVLTTIINIACYRLCTTIHMVYWLANAAAWVVAVIFAFITNKLYVFESKSMAPAVVIKEAIAFVTARLFSGACDMAFMIFAVELVGMNDFLAKLISNVFVVIINYVFSKLFIFNKKTVQE